MYDFSVLLNLKYSFSASSLAGTFPDMWCSSDDSLLYASPFIGLQNSVKQQFSFSSDSVFCRRAEQSRESLRLPLSSEINCLIFIMHLQEFVTVLVRDPRIQKEDSWHSYIDYEIFIHVSTKI